MKQTKKQRSARGQDCTLQIPNVCNFNRETTVLAHVGSGSAKRRDDDQAVYACSDCHDAIDRRSKVFLSDNPEEQELLRIDRLWFIQRALEKMAGIYHD
jgi:hypothetical protein